ncbi:MAG: polysaccharide deacetylase family protein, partial [Bacteroidales bacterium]|nr:polysaccharide deacetylase family protein [Bacteroidales bacterium]
MQKQTLLRLLGLSLALIITGATKAQDLSITANSPTGDYIVGEEIAINVKLENFTPSDPSYLHSWVDASGYRKLKLGNNPYNYYNPAVDVISGGNTMMTITMRVKDDQTTWKKMLLRPNGKSNKVKLSNYVPTDIIVNEWFTFSIPLADFDELIDFTILKNIEFPYSGGANHFDWDIYSIIFTGGANQFVWLGAGNINNAHNGNGGSGEVFAEWNLSSNPDLELPELRLFHNDILSGAVVGMNADFTLTPATAGTHTIRTEAWSGQSMIASTSMDIQLTEATQAEIAISITSPLENDQCENAGVVTVSTEITGDLQMGPDYLKVLGLPDGWRKLKIGNNPTSLYTPKVDVTSSGNSVMEIILREPENILDWSKIDLRPQGNAKNPISLDAYWDQRELLDEDWIKISIPLNAFDTSIDFTALSNIEFPYSKGAGVFEIHIQDIRFTGGGTEFIWFGEDKTNNIQDGFGNPGQLLAELIQADNGGYETIRADLYLDDILIQSDFTLPFGWELTELTTGLHQVHVILNLDAQQVNSQTVQFTVLEPIMNTPEINLDPYYSLEIIPTGKSFPVSGNILNIAEGENFQVELLIDNQIISSSDQTTFDFIADFPLAGNHEWLIRVITASGLESVSEAHQVQAIDLIGANNLTILTPETNQTFLQNTDIPIQAQFIPEETGELPYLEIANPGTGYRKLKIGNNPVSLYSPQLNLLEGGNTHLDITIKLLDGTPNFSKLTICPQEVTSNAPLLGTYWGLAEDLGDGWKKVHIPLADFDAGINFESLSFIAFPYSRDAGYFKFALREISFTGGSSPYLYFGDPKLDNIHDGLGNPGQLLASLADPNQFSAPDRYDFFLDNLYIGTVANQSELTHWISGDINTHNLQVSAHMSDGSIIISQPSTFSIIEPIPDTQSIVLKLSFDHIENVSIQKARLRYNKSFAYSLTLDDGLDDAFTNAFKTLNGGYVEGNGQTYPGLFFTDGCGNDLPFSGGLAWYSVSSNFNDLHTNTPGYIKWDELIDMYNAGWDVLNHSYSHETAETTDHFFQIDENQKIVFEKTGINMTQFIIPGGAVYLPYIQVAKDYGMNAIYAYKSDFTGYPLGIQVDNTRTWEDMTIYRGYNFDDSYNTTNITQKIDQIASAISPENHIWYNDFTHR